MVGDNKDDVVISGLAKDEIFPELFDIIKEVKNRFELKGQLKVFIVDEFQPTPNLMADHKVCFNFDKNPLKNFSIRISRGILKILNPKENPDELKVFIAHEMSHIKHEDVPVLKEIFAYYILIGGIISGLLSISTLLLTNNLGIAILILIFVFISSVIIGQRNLKYEEKYREERADNEPYL